MYLLCPPGKDTDKNVLKIIFHFNGVTTSLLYYIMLYYKCVDLLKHVVHVVHVTSTRQNSRVSGIDMLYYFLCGLIITYALKSMSGEFSVMNMRTTLMLIVNSLSQ